MARPRNGGRREDQILTDEGTEGPYTVGRGPAGSAPPSLTGAQRGDPPASSPERNDFDLTEPRNDELYRVVGNFIFNDGDGEVEVKPNSKTADSYVLRPGQHLQGIQFDDLYISNDAQEDKHADLISTYKPGARFDVSSPKMLLVRGDLEGALEGIIPIYRGTSGELDCENTTDISIAPGGQVDVDGVETRVSLTIIAHPDNDELIRVGPQVADDRGIPLPAGGSYDFETNEDLSVRNPSTNSGDQVFTWYAEQFNE